jgi:hypothetical protein
VGGRRWRSAQCLCEATRQPTMWCNDDVVVPRRRRRPSILTRSSGVGIMTDETMAFNIADNDLRAVALSCDANAVNLHHPLHPLVDAWEYVVGSTMYGEAGQNTGCRGAGEALTRTTKLVRVARVVGSQDGRGRQGQGDHCVFRVGSEGAMHGEVPTRRAGGGTHTEPARSEAVLWHAKK